MKGAVEPVVARNDRNRVRRFIFGPDCDREN